MLTSIALIEHRLRHGAALVLRPGYRDWVLLPAREKVYAIDFVPAAVVALMTAQGIIETEYSVAGRASLIPQNNVNSQESP